METKQEESKKLKNKLMSFYFHHCLLCLLTTGTFDYSELADIETFDFADFE